MLSAQSLLPLVLLFTSLAVAAEPGDFRDPFKEKLAPGWTWVREDASAWKISDKGLEVRILPGNMWGGANNARNVLVRPAPNPADGDIDVSVTVRNAPTEQWEQCDLVWYYDDSHMVKCGQEKVDGKLTIVMGREQADRTRTIKIVPLDSTTVTLRLLVQGNQIRGFFRRPDDKEFQEVGVCELPTPPKGAKPHFSLQFYNGPAKVERWALVTDFTVTQKK